MIVKIKKSNPSIPTPVYKTAGAAGCDVTASEYITLRPGESSLVKTGLFLEIPEGFECQVRPRSGLAAKHGITVLNSPGTIDSDYRGELGVILVNHGSETYTVKEGERIAQLVFAPVVQASFVEVDELSSTVRNDRGFGSPFVS